jgi:ribosomal protein S18 acetylase RimI-like enzyme
MSGYEVIMKVVPLTTEDAIAVASLHRSAIDKGFLSALGRRFTERMYGAILSCPLAFGYGVKDERGQILGFIVCAEDVKKTYRFSLLHHGLSMALPLLRCMCRPSMIRRLWETLRYPVNVGQDMPQGEVLSIAVCPEARSKGVGQVLMEAGLAEFYRRGNDRIKVSVGADNDCANHFYVRCGFRLAITRLHHGLLMNVYVVQLSGASTSLREAVTDKAQASRSIRISRMLPASAVAH